MRTLKFDNAQYLPQVVELIRQGHSVSLPATGTSMRPWIEPGRHALVLGPAEAYCKGDVALAEVAPGQYVVHRIIGMRSPQGQPLSGPCSDPLIRVILRGDGCVRQREQCTLRRLHARLEAVATLDGKSITPTSSRRWRAYSRLWTLLSPLRRPLLALHRLIWHHQLPARWQKHLHTLDRP